MNISRRTRGKSRNYRHEASILDIIVSYIIKRTPSISREFLFLFKDILYLQLPYDQIDFFTKLELSYIFCYTKCSNIYLK